MPFPSPSALPNYKAFWLSRYIAFVKWIAKAMYLEKPKRLIIWNGGSTRDHKKLLQTEIYIVS
jgi:hypothetical protein